jgi:trimeric autotransporter adhesin
MLKTYQSKHKQSNMNLKLHTAKLFLLGMLAFIQTPLQAQVLTITGSGTTSSYLYSPMYSISAAPRLEKTANHYPYIQLSQGGLPTGAAITAVEYERAAGTNAMIGSPNLKLYIINLPSTSLDNGTGTLTWSTLITGATLVYDGDPSTIAGTSPGWKTFPFGTGPGTSSSFIYTGGALAIYSEWTQTTAQGTTINWIYQNGTTSLPNNNGWTTNSTKYTVSSSTTAPTTLASSSINHPNTQFIYSTTPCSAPPNPGTASGPASVCQNSSATVSLAGQSSGLGLTIQWEYFDLGTSTWQPIVGATGPSYLIPSLTATTQYHAVVTCSANSQPSNAVTITVNPQLPAGTYTINNGVATGGSNFTSFTDAAAAMSCGIAGPVIFNVTPGSGPYNEQVSFPAVPGTSATNTITINGNNATISYAASLATAPHTLALNSTDYVTINNLSIIGTGATYALACHLWNGADNNTFSNCTFTTPVNGTAATQVPFSISGSETSATTTGLSGSGNLITDCYMNNGNYGAVLYGYSTTVNTGNQLINNNIKDFNTAGVYIVYQNGAIVRANLIERPTRTTLPATSYGIHVTTGGSNTLVEKNRIRNPFAASLTNTGTFYGIYSNVSATSGNENKYYNNLIYEMKSNGVLAGIYLTLNYAKIYHNTIAIDHPTADGISTTTYGIWLAGTAGLDVKNNIISIMRGGTGQKQCLSYAANTGISSNYNDLFMFSTSGTTNYTGFCVTGFGTLTAWQTANGGIWDSQSKGVNPLFANAATGDFTPTQWTLDNVSVSVGVTTDIMNVTRAAAPDPGAYEFTSPPCTGTPSVGTAFITPGTICAGSNAYLYLTGASTGTSLNTQWEYYNTATSSWTAVPGANSTNHVATPTTSTMYRVVVSCGANSQISDTVSVIVNGIMAGGTYTINNALPTSGTNFNSFTDAAAAWTCGISGPIVLNVAAGSGPYTEQVTFTATTGSSATNTLTINGNGTTLTYGASTVTDAHTLMFEGTDYVTVNDLNVSNTGTTYGLACHLWNGADNNTFNNCTFTCSQTATSATVCPFSITGTPNIVNSGGVGLSGSNNMISNCNVIGGYYGLTLVGGSAAIATGNQVINCTIKEWYTTGPYLYYQSGAIIRGNVIERPTRTTTTTAYGIYVLTGTVNLLAEKNRIRNLFGAAVLATNTSICYGIYSSVDGTAGNENKYYNNIISDMKGAGIQGGIYLNGADYAKVYHNTISLEYTAAIAGATYGIYSTGTVGGNEIKNNVVVVRRGGSGAKYCIYLAGVQIANNNAYYISTNGTLNNVGYFGADFLTLANWQSANSGAYDAQSKFFDPLFTNPAANDYTPTEWQIDNMGVSVGITTDILGATRAAIPDVGAYEFTVPPCTTPPAPGVASVNTSNICSGNSITLSVTGQSSGTGTTLQWQYYDNATSAWVTLGGATLNSVTTTAATTTQYRTAVTCSGNTTYSNAVTVNVVPLFISGGTYTLNSAAPTGGTNFQTIAALDSALLCGLSGALTVIVNAAGTYNGQLHLKNMGSAAAPITINGNGATFSYSPTADLDRACIKMDNADYVTINNLNIVSPVGSAYGFGIQLINDADNNTISGCTITCDPLIATATHVGISVSGSHNAGNAVSSNCDTVIVTGCTINGGFYGVTLFGNGLTTPINGCKVLNNTIMNTYNVGVYTNGNNYSLIQGNDFSRPNRISSGNCYGVLLSGGNLNCVVNANKVHNMFGSFQGSSNPQYSLGITGAGSAGYPCTFSNNIVYDQNTIRGVQYGLYNSGGSYVNYYYNTIIADYNTGTPGTAATAGFYQTGAATDIVLKNNIFKITREGTGIRAGLYFATAGTTFISDYNDIYVSSVAGTNMIGYNGASYFPLSAWQTSPGAPDANSKSVDPEFTLTSAGGLVPTSALLNNQGVVLPVTTDITGTTRSSTPDMGAYEYTNPSCLPVLSISSSSITQTSATLTWPAVAGSAGYQYVVSTTNAVPGTGTAQTSNTVSLTGLTPATRYYVFVRNNCGSGFSPWSSSLFATRPVNDDCANAIDISNQLASSGTTLGGTQTMAAGTCATSTALANDVWYSFTLTQISNVEVDATNTVGDMVMEVLSGTCGSFTQMDCQDAPAVGTEVTILNALPIGTYYVRVYGFLSIEAPIVVQITAVPLSIKLIEIAAKNTGSRNIVNWATSDEDNGDYFILERSADGKDFKPLATVSGKGSASEYTYNDIEPFVGINYYRLKLVDASGKASYSKVVSALVKAGAFDVKAYPNPVTDKLHVKIQGELGANATLSLLDVQGKTISVIKNAQTDNTIDMSEFSSGVFFIRYIDEHQNKIIKINKQ